jgi:hypothetical protein
MAFGAGVVGARRVVRRHRGVRASRRRGTHLVIRRRPEGWAYLRTARVREQAHPPPKCARWDAGRFGLHVGAQNDPDHQPTRQRTPRGAGSNANAHSFLDAHRTTHRTPTNDRAERHQQTRRPSARNTSARPAAQPHDASLGSPLTIPPPRAPTNHPHQAPAYSPRSRTPSSSNPM